jgi:hypothetical protein
MQVNEGPVYRYAIVGMLVTDTPLDRADFDQYVIDGTYSGLLEAVERLPRRATKIPLGTADWVLDRLSDIVEMTKNDNRAGDQMVFVCRAEDLTKIEKMMGREVDYVRISRNGWMEIEYRISDHEALERRRAGANQGICWIGWTERGDERLFEFVSDGKLEIEYTMGDLGEDPDSPFYAFQTKYNQILKEILGTDQEIAPAYMVP